MGFLNFSLPCFFYSLLSVPNSYRDSFLELLTLGLHESIEISVLN